MPFSRPWLGRPPHVPWPGIRHHSPMRCGREIEKEILQKRFCVCGNTHFRQWLRLRSIYLRIPLIITRSTSTRVFRTNKRVIDWQEARRGEAERGKASLDVEDNAKDSLHSSRAWRAATWLNIQFVCVLRRNTYSTFYVFFDNVTSSVSGFHFWSLLYVGWPGSKLVKLEEFIFIFNF